MTTVVFLAAAETDVLEHYARLEEAREGIGDRLCQHLDAALSLISRHPFIARKLRGKIRRVVVTRFHLGVFYAVEANRIMVCRVLDLRQSPANLGRALKPFQ